MDAVAVAVAPADVRSRPSQRGTGDAVAAARGGARRFRRRRAGALRRYAAGHPATFEQLLAERRRAPEAAVAVIGMRPAEPGAYGRLVLGGDGTLDGDRRGRRCTRRTARHHAVQFRRDGDRWASISSRCWTRVGSSNAKGEYYLTDIVAVARARGLACRAIEAPADELMGVNSRAELAAAEAAMQRRLRAQAHGGGRHVHRARDRLPQRRYAARPRQRGRALRRLRSRGDGRRGRRDPGLLPYRRRQGRRSRDHRAVRPAAARAPSSAPSVHIGNFVEVKNAHLGRGVKANHSAYLGDA